MEARTELRRTWISKQAMVAVSLLAAIALVGAGAYTVKGLSLTTAHMAKVGSASGQHFVGTHVAIARVGTPHAPLGSQQTPSYTFIGTHVPTHRAQHASNHTASDG
jgi:hypothetical protein